MSSLPDATRIRRLHLLALEGDVEHGQRVPSPVYIDALRDAAMMAVRELERRSPEQVDQVEAALLRYARHTDRFCHSARGGIQHPMDRCMCGLDEELRRLRIDPTEVRGPGAAQRYRPIDHPYKARILAAYMEEERPA